MNDISKKYILHTIKEQYDDNLFYLYKRYFDKCQSWELGRNRFVFMMKSYVIKLPWSDGGFGDNDWEGSVSNLPEYIDNNDYIQYARTRMVYWKDIPILFMEYVKYTPYKDLKKAFNKIPMWVDFVDGQQVGYNKSGRLVAFDYGRN